MLHSYAVLLLATFLMITGFVMSLLKFTKIFWGV